MAKRSPQTPAADASTEDAVVVPKRGRGRPRKVPLDPNAAPTEAAVPVAKRKRGRPRKTDAGAAPTPRKPRVPREPMVPTAEGGDDSLPQGTTVLLSEVLDAMAVVSNKAGREPLRGMSGPARRAMLERLQPLVEQATPEVRARLIRTLAEGLVLRTTTPNVRYRVLMAVLNQLALSPTGARWVPRTMITPGADSGPGEPGEPLDKALGRVLANQPILPMAAMEAAYLRLTMDRVDGNVHRAAAELDLTRQTIYNLCRRYEIPCGAAWRPDRARYRRTRKPKEDSSPAAEAQD